MKTKEQLQHLRNQRQAFDIDNAAWLLPLREAFHVHLESHEGYAPMTTPAPGASYPGSHAQMLWECWLAATLHARPELPHAPEHPAHHQQ